MGSRKRKGYGIDGYGQGADYYDPNYSRATEMSAAERAFVQQMQSRGLLEQVPSWGLPKTYRQYIEDSPSVPPGMRGVDLREWQSGPFELPTHSRNRGENKRTYGQAFQDAADTGAQLGRIALTNPRMLAGLVSGISSMAYAIPRAYQKWTDSRSYLRNPSKYTPKSYTYAEGRSFTRAQNRRASQRNYYLYR